MLQLRDYIIDIKSLREFYASENKEKNYCDASEEIIENANEILERDYIRDSNKRYFTWISDPNLFSVFAEKAESLRF